MKQNSRNVILAGICLKEDAAGFKSGMEECKALCRAADFRIVSMITQNSQSLDPRTAFRSGKIAELKLLVEKYEADLIVFYNDLGLQTTMRISASCLDVEVIDRTSLILHIFSLRARTRQAKLQIEMAGLQYALPGLNDASQIQTHQRGGSVTNRGAGEMRSSILVSQYRHRIKELKNQLRQIQKDHSQDESRRSKTLLKRAALIGYTNAGKSSFMNQMLMQNHAGGSPVAENDRLFETLDTNVRLIQSKGKQYFLYDTVGFVSHMPEQLLDAFHTTLSSVLDADLLIHIIDRSDPDWMKKMQATKKTLEQIGAEKIPVLTVYNKMDLVQDDIDGLCISSRTGEGIDEVQNHIVNSLYPPEVSMCCLLPYEEMRLYDDYKKIMDITLSGQNEQGMIIHVHGPKAYMDAFQKFQIKGENYGKENSLGKNE